MYVFPWKVTYSYNFVLKSASNSSYSHVSVCVFTSATWDLPIKKAVNVLLPDVPLR